MLAYRSQHSLASILLAASLLCWMVGCQPDSSSNNTDDSGDGADGVSALVEPTASSVPLRIWIAAELTAPEVFNRQWLAHSEQPIELRQLSVEELLAEEECSCDVLLVPARQLGELIEREWIRKLPDAALLTSELSEGGELAVSSAAAVAQTTFREQRYAIPLGCALPTVVVSPSLATELDDQPVTWQELQTQLDQQDASGQSSEEPQPTSVDSDAIVDRFLAVLATLTERDSKYGLLFDMQTMQPSLKEPEFYAAGEILVRLSQQPGGQAAVLGSHDDAWQWALQHKAPVAAVAVPAQLSPESAKLTGGKTITITSKSNLPGWNTGGGLVAALPAECRQTSRANSLLRWLQSSQTRTAIAPVIEGIESSTPLAGANATSWLARQKQAEILSNSDLPREPSLPLTYQLRQLLAAQLVAAVRGEKSAQQAITDAHTSWRELTQRSAESLRYKYQGSLGLSF